MLTKILSKILTILFLFIPVFFPLSPVFADGMVIPGGYHPGWDFTSEKSQQAFINYIDGYEKLILSIDLERKSQDNLWIFPVPSDYRDVTIDVVTELPSLSGGELADQARDVAFGMEWSLLGTQIYPLFFYPFLGTSYYTPGGVVPLTVPEKSTESLEPDVTVRQELEKEGITTQVLTAKTADGLFSYFEEKGLNIKEDSIPILSKYIGKDYTFIASFLSSPSDVGSRPEPLSSQEKELIYPYPNIYSRGVFVSFPTEKLFYPLMLTSVYDTEIIPTDIRIVGLKSPEIFRDIKSHAEVKYFREEYISYYNEKFYGENSSQAINYTKISLKAPANLFTDDLWIKNQAPAKTILPLLVVKYPFLILIFAFILLSAVSSMIIGLLVFKEKRNRLGALKLALFGLFNFFTLIAFALATVVWRSKPIPEEDKKLFLELKSRGYGIRTLHLRDVKRKAIFIAGFSATFIIITLVFFGLLGLALG